jgi:Mn-containing catalase
MFFHSKGLQFEANPSEPDPLYAVRLQEVLGGQFGEITVAMQYLLQGWNAKMPGKYKDMILDIGTEELAHIEMLSIMIGKLLEGAPAEVAEKQMAGNPALAAVWGGMDPQHAIVAGFGARFADSRGNPWNAGYIVASGNLMADFRANVNAESQGRLQVARLFGMTDDPGVKKMLSFMLARDTMHQNQWIAAIEQLKEDGLEDTPVPSGFDQSQEYQAASYQFWNLSSGEESREGRWASGTSPDGKGEFSYLENPGPTTGEPTPPRPAKELYVTGDAKGMVSGLVDKAKNNLLP